MTTPDIIRAHRHSSHHRDEILASDQCGCFCCSRVFPPGEIQFWTDYLSNENAIGQTATCPYCGVDSVIGSESGYPVTKSFLQQMKEHWFRGVS